MATTTRTNTAADYSGLSGQVRQQLLANVKQAETMTLEAALAAASVVSAMPNIASNLPGVPSRAEAAAIIGDGYGLALDLLASQRDFTKKLVGVLAPSK
jgi:hypothetical protein